MPAELKKIWSILTPSERRRARLMLVLVLLMAAAEMMGVISIVPFLTVLGRPAVVQENPWLSAAYVYLGFSNTQDFILTLGVASIAIVVTSAAFKTVTQFLLNRFVHMLRHAISMRLLARYLHQPYEFHLTRNSSTLSKNVLSESDQLIFDLVQPLSQLFSQGAVVIAIALLIFFYDPITALSAVAALSTLYGLIYKTVRTRLSGIGRERQSANAQRYQACSEALGGVKDVKVTHSDSAYLEKFGRASRNYSRHTATNETLNQTPLYLVEAVGYSGLIVIALVLLLRSNDVAHVLPALGLYGFAAYRMLPSAQIMYRGFARLKFASAALDSIHRDLSLPEEPASESSHPLRLRKEIRLQGICYAYPSSPDRPVLDGLDMVIPVNTSIGIVGRSGAGKSTLLDILLGLLRPQSGQLTVDDTAITPATAPAWQKAIGYVPQHIYLADATVAENIAFGVARQDIDMQAVERAACAAQIHAFVSQELEYGYDTPVGERGVRLSGGQRQRIGIARALYRDPDVLLMDEATSALDAQTEEALNDALRGLHGRKTIVVIAHRESSLRDCQQIFDLGQHQGLAAAD